MGKEIFDYLKANFKVYTVEECKQLKNEGAFGVIYMTKCKINNKLYIGQKKIDTKDFNTYLGSGTLFKQAVKKYGKENFERIILEVAYSKEELDNFEIKYIELFDASEGDLFYNIALGGSSGVCLKGEDNPNYKEKTTFKCDYCGKEIKKLESHVKNNKNVFCSQQCNSKWQREYLKGKNSPNYKGYVVVYPNGEVSEEMAIEELANYLNVSSHIISDLGKEKTCYIGKCEHIKYIRVLCSEDYKKEKEIYKSDEDFRNMCKRMVEEAKILEEIKKEEESKKRSEAKKGKNNPNYGKPHSEEHRKRIGEAHKKLLVAIFPDGRIIKDVCMKELAKELGTTRQLVTRILDLKQPYTVSKSTRKSDLERLKPLEGIVVMEQKDYLNIIENKFSKAS